MKTLMLLRHAKSDWSDPDAYDYERTLNQRGFHDAFEMGQRLLKRGLIPDLFIASTAKRARLSVELLAEAMAYSEDKILWRKNLYLATPATMMEVISNTPEQVNCLALLAHNPGITALAELLSGQCLGNVPTAGVVTLTSHTQHWHEAACLWHLQDFDYPKRSPS